jgi:GT2 family glycosyltransferase
MEKIDVSIIIVNFKTPSLVLNCVTSIIECSLGFSYEIIVVDNSNEVGEYKLLSQYLNRYPKVIVLNPEKNLGFGLANNLGAKLAHGQFLLFLNSDTLLLNNAIKAMIDVFASNSEAGVVGTNLFSSKKKPAHSFLKNEQNINEIKRSSNLLTILKRKIDISYQFNFSKKEKIIDGYITGACLMVPHALFFSIGGFSKDIFMYEEDNLLCTQIKKKGFKLINTPKGEIIHLEGKSDEKIFSDFKIHNIVDGTFIFAREAYGISISIQYLLAEYKVFRKSSFRNKIFKEKVKYSNNSRLSEAFYKKYKEKSSEFQSILSK